MVADNSKPDRALDAEEAAYEISVNHWRPLIVVAHPDDETLWAGGLISRIQAPTVVCCTIPARDPIRAWKFYSAVKALNIGATALTSPYAEGPPNVLLPNALLQLLFGNMLGNFGVVITHGESGEYSHPHHIAVHRFFRDCKEMYGKPLYGFSVGDTLEMSEATWQRKLHGLKRYNHPSPTSFGVAKWEELLTRWGTTFNLRKEGFRRVDSSPA